MPVSKKDLESQIKLSFPDADIALEDTVGDQNHYSLFITSAQFKDKNQLQRHRMVNEALKDMLKQDLHAISIKAEVKN